MNTGIAIERVDRRMMIGIPLLTGLDDPLLSDMESHALCTRYKKGDTILRQGEVCSRLYIMIEGWVGVKRTNSYGEESILDILTEGCAFPCFRIEPLTTCSADIVALCESRILSFPLMQVIEWVEHSALFAKKLLGLAQDSLNRTIDHVDQLTLRTAEQRVGAFLLYMKLGCGKGKTSFALPFEKVVVASYLGIKPETFSRALGSLKEQGVLINRQTITLPDEHALCGYYDQRLARHCPDADTDMCENPLSDTVHITNDPLR